MNATGMQIKVIRELHQIPEPKLHEIYDVNPLTHSESKLNLIILPK